MQSFAADFKRRIAEIKPTRWVRFGLVSLLLILWSIWMGNLWLSLFVILLFDIYITGYIPLTWWKQSKKPWVRIVMSWVDAIVYAIVLVYFVFAFIGQNYQIPSSSLEKTLLTGDYLWVNKMVYGPRVPITPIHFPLVHNKLPLLNCDSYTDRPELSYKRLKGLRSVESGDIVVFNFPAGDTVAVNFEERPEYYETLVRTYGWHEVNTNKQKFGEIKYRPVDRRQNYVKRAVGLPGERLKIVNDTIYINGVMQKMPENVQFNYLISTSSPFTEDIVREQGITPTDVFVVDNQFKAFLPNAGLYDYMYLVPLTDKMIADLKNSGFITDYRNFYSLPEVSQQVESMFPYGGSEGWSPANYGGEEGILIPKRGMTIDLTPENWTLYHRAIRNYEHHTNSWIDGETVYIDGKPASTYTFDMDYYFMMGDNRHNSLDSRFWGFVPEDHIVGTPMVVLISFDQTRSLFDGGIRWNRIFRTANPDK